MNRPRPNAPSTFCIEPSLAVGIVLACAFILCPPPSQASAWQVSTSHGQIIVTSSYYRTSSEFDQNGRIEYFGSSGEYRQILTSTYMEFKLSHRDSAILSVPGEFLRFSDAYGNESTNALGDIAIGWKRLLSPLESRWALSAQGLVSFPAYSAAANPAPGNHQEDVESRVMFGRGVDILRRHVFLDLESAYRYRSGAPADQVRDDGTIGFYPFKKTMLMGQVFTIKSMRNGAPLAPNSNPNAQSDFDLYQYEPSIVQTIRHGLQVQVGWSTAFSGRNTGRGTTAVLSLWESF